MQPSHAGTKRKLEAIKDPNEVYKFAKASANGDSKGKRKAVVEDDPEDDGAAGPDPPPADEEVAYGPEDDEEGRFFGGGITKNTAEILDFMDEQEKDDAGPEKIDSAWLRKFALNFEKYITTNAELRAKFESEPQKFMGSEADLDAEIKALSILSEHPGLYEDFAKLGCVNSLVSLLAHENTDIAIDAIQIISELTDEDVEADEGHWDALVNAMVGVLENLASKPAISERIGTEAAVLPWLLKRIQQKESPISQNKQYAAEVFEILLQSSETNRTRLAELDGIDFFLQLLSTYRKRDPEKDSYEEEYMENLFGCLISAVRELEGKKKFVAAEGVELCLIMLKEGKMSKPRALRLLDHAMQGQGGVVAAEALVEAAGLKTVFGMLMKKQSHSATEHILGILSALLRSLPANSAGRIRTLAKFVEKGYEKITKIMELRREYSSRLKIVDQDIKKQRAAMSVDDREDMEAEWLSRRLDAGLFCLQTADLILAWLVAEDDGARKHINSSLTKQGESLEAVKASLQEQLKSIENNEAEASETEEMLSTLIQCL
ncbi:MAG: hypothetical protein M1823_000862 [Watsoniomyces obsoletus]|nr:MAG: hypothetical protein M1823_000862 [Watsoniomyces obsoletus]